MIERSFGVWSLWTMVKKKSEKKVSEKLHVDTKYPLNGIFGFLIGYNSETTLFRIKFLLSLDFLGSNYPTTVRPLFCVILFWKGSPNFLRFSVSEITKNGGHAMHYSKLEWEPLNQFHLHLSNCKFFTLWEAATNKLDKVKV